MNTFQLTCFLKVADTLSFASAARELNVTQPAISHQIHTLESELEVKLFKRTTRVVELTMEGKMFIEDARSMISIAHRAKKRFEYKTDRVVRYFSIGCQSSSQLFQLPEILRKMMAVYPSVHPQFHVVPFLHVYRLLEEENVDVIVGFKELDSRKIAGTYRELCKIPVVCVCSQDHPLANESVVSMDRLNGEKIIVSDPSKIPGEISNLQGQILSRRSPSEVFFCDSPEAAVILMMTGCGVGILPESFLPPEHCLVKIPIEGVEALSYGVYYKRLQGNEMLKTFIGLLEEGLAIRKSWLP